MIAFYFLSHFLTSYKANYNFILDFPGSGAAKNNFFLSVQK